MLHRLTYPTSSYAWLPHPHIRSRRSGRRRPACKQRIQFGAPFVVLWLAAVSLQAQPDAASLTLPKVRPRNVIIMISDGMGPTDVTLARLVSGKESLALDEHLVGTRQTSSSDKIVTDSAAAATAMSTGRLTRNEYVGLTPGAMPLGNILEAAKFQRKMAVGLVVKSRITGATPAAFSAHVKDRDDEERIAVQQLGLHPDLMFGGGTDYFLPRAAGGKRRDNRDLLAEARSSGYQVLTTAGDLAGRLRLPVLGLFNNDNLHFEIDRPGTTEPSLDEMTRKALQLLAAQKEGFLLMIEGSEIDHTGHANDAGALVPEVVSYDAAFAAAIEFAKREGRTLVVSTSDHDTGGLAITGADRTPVKPGPLRLRANKASADAMVTMIANGRPLPDVLRDYAGVTGVTPQEVEAFEAASPGPASELQNRRIAAIVKIINARAGIKWAHTEHTAVDVNLYAFGPGQDLFRGSHPATWMATVVGQLLGLDMEEATREARERIKGDVGR